MRRVLVVFGLLAATAITLWGVLAVLGPAARVEALVLPPPHSTAPAFSFKLGKKQPAPIAVGSDILLRVNGRRADELTITLMDGTRVKTEPTPSTNRWAQLRASEVEPMVLILTLDDNARQVPLEIVADSAPKIRWSERPAHDLSGKVRLAFTASDDLSLTDVKLIVAASDAGLDINPARPVVTALPLGTTTLTRAVHLDLADHPLAGRNVALVLEVTDGAGNVSRSAPAYLPLPKARMSDRTAQIIASLADELLADPAATQKVATLLTAIAMSPQEYGDDLTSFLALRIAYRRLTGLSLLYGLPRYPLPPATADRVADVRPLLLDTARRIDDGPEATSYAIYEAALDGVPAALENDDRRYQALSLLAYAINAYAHDLTASEILLSPEDLIGRLLLAIDDAANDNNYASAQNALDTLSDLVENISFGVAAVPPEGRLGVLTAIGTEARGVQGLRERIIAATDEPGRIPDLKASLNRRITTLRGLLKKQALSGEAAPLIHSASGMVSAAGQALSAQDWPRADTLLADALGNLSDAGQITAQSIVSTTENRLITAGLPSLFPASDLSNRAATLPENAAKTEQLADDRLNDCGYRSEGQCAPGIRARLSRIVDHTTAP